MSLKVLIVEDEHLGMERLERQLTSLEKNIEIVGLADSVRTAVAWLKTNTPPDLIFMDIDLGDGQSFEIFNLADVKSHVIFTTSYDEHALHAFQSNNIDYLLKPMRKSDLNQVLEKYLSSGPHVNNDVNQIENLVRSLKRQLAKGRRQQFLARDGKKMISVDLGQVSYFFTEHQRHYLRTRDKKRLVIERSLDEIESLIDPLVFFRINEDWLVANASVVKIHAAIDGQLLVQLRPGNEKEVPVQADKIVAFKNWIKR